MALYKDKYRIESARLRNWDYGSNGQYFITICTKNRECLFGEIINGEMQLSHMGIIVFREWYASFNIRSELFCNCFVIMPNHLHGIIVINNSVNIHDVVETHGRASLRNNGTERRAPMNRIMESLQ